MDPKLLTPVLIGALLVFAIARRMRRSFGRQTVQPTRMRIRIGILSVVGALAAINYVHDLTTFGALLAGAAAGAALGYVGLKHTQFEVTPQGRYYTPHTYLGLVVTALFLGRIAYRFLFLYQGAAAAAQQSTSYVYQRSPMTVASFGLLVSYYLVYYLGILSKTKTLAAPATQPGSP